MKKYVALLIVAIIMLTTFTACGHTHAFGEWAVKTEANCTADGLQERVCDCGEVETEAIPAAHKYEVTKEIKKVTCSEDGEVEKTCSVCSNKVTEVVKSTGHDFAPASDFAPKTCKNCKLTEGEALSKALKKGDTAEDASHKFTVEDAFFTSALKEKRGYITYNYSQSDYVLAIKLNFENLATEDFERWNSARVSDVSLQYQGKYSYTGEYWCPDDDIVPLSSDTIYMVFAVPKSMSEDKESAIYTKFTIDGVVYSMIIQEGKLATNDNNTSTDEGKNTAADIKVGDTRSDVENFSFVFKDLYYTTKPQEKNGNVTHSYGSDGKYYLVCKLDFTNNASEAFDDFGSERISNMKLSFAGKYDYDGKLWIPSDEIVPLANGNVYILFEVPKTVETDAGALNLEFTVDGTTFKVDCRTAK